MFELGIDGVGPNPQNNQQLDPRRARTVCCGRTYTRHGVIQQQAAALLVSAISAIVVVASAVLAASSKE